MVLCKLTPRRNRNRLQLANSLFNEFFGGFENPALAEFTPRTDIVENEKEIKISCELPGLDEKDISLALSDDMLVIEGEKKAENETQGAGYHHIERRYGSFKRVIHLDSEVDNDNIRAKFKKGVLKVTLVKAPHAEETVKKIPINSN